MSYQQNGTGFKDDIHSEAPGHALTVGTGKEDIQPDKVPRSDPCHINSHALTTKILVQMGQEVANRKAAWPEDLQKTIKEVPEKGNGKGKCKGKGKGKDKGKGKGSMVYRSAMHCIRNCHLPPLSKKVRVRLAAGTRMSHNNPWLEYTDCVWINPRVSHMDPRQHNHPDNAETRRNIGGDLARRVRLPAMSLSL